jgi:dihydroneopterin aldolase
MSDLRCRISDLGRRSKEFEIQHLRSEISKLLLMDAIFTISLEGLRFFAPHGVYDAEAATGNSFEVDLQLETSAGKEVKSLDQTVNYATVYELISTRMQVRTALLETLCQQIAGDVELHFPAVRRITISIKKLTPAIAHFNGLVGVSFSKVCNPQP